MSTGHLTSRQCVNLSRRAVPDWLVRNARSSYNDAAAALAVDLWPVMIIDFTASQSLSRRSKALRLNLVEQIRLGVEKFGTKCRLKSVRKNAASF